MADKYLNTTGLQYFYNRIKTIFALKSEIPTATSELTNDGDGESNFATETYVGQHGGKIDVIQVNGTAQTITNKTVNITVPTVVSDLTNDSGYQTASEVEAAISSAVASAVTLKGSVATYNDLPSTGNKNGDMYDVLDTGENYVWIVEGGSGRWDAYTTAIDTSLFWAKAELVAITTAEIDTITA